MIQVFQCALFFSSPRTSPSFNFSFLELLLPQASQLLLVHKILIRAYVLSSFFLITIFVVFYIPFQSKHWLCKNHEVWCEDWCVNVTFNISKLLIIKFEVWLLSHRTLSRSFHVNFTFAIAFNKACLVNPMILSNWPP